MKFGKSVLCFALLCFTFFFGVSANADASMPKFSTEFSTLSPERGDSIKVKINVENSLDLSAFILDLDYNEEVLEFKYVTCRMDGYFEEHDNGSLTHFVFASTEISNFSGALVEFTYAVKEDIADSLTQIDVTVEDLVNKSLTEIEHKYISQNTAEVQALPSGEALLLHLIPSAGELSPAFSPDIFSYEIDVPYSVEDMEFLAQVSDGAGYSINRKNLGSGGSTTEFVVKVVSEDESTENEYVISVTRGEYVRATSSDENTSNKNVYILELSPNTGVLNEKFSPDIYVYTMDVPYETEIMSFSYVVEDNVQVSVNRKNLGSGGSTTEFTLTAKEDDAKTEYTVLVTRGEYVRASASDSTDDESSSAQTAKSNEEKSEEIDESAEPLKESAELTIESSDNSVWILSAVIIAMGSALIIFMIHTKNENKNLIKTILKLNDAKNHDEREDKSSEKDE